MNRLAVLIPTYNRMSLLAECLFALHKQTFQDFEILVYDDGSCDETRLKIHQAQKVNSHVWYSYSIKNHGVGYARNCLLDMARDMGCEFAAWQDSDDLSNIHRFQKQLMFLEQNRCCMLSTCHARLTDQNRQEVYQLPMHVEGDRGWSLGSTMFRVSEAVEFNDKVKLGGEDSDWKIAMGEAGIRRENHPLRLYYIRMTNKDRIGRQKQRDKAGKAKSDAHRT